MQNQKTNVKQTHPCLYKEGLRPNLERDPCVVGWDLILESGAYVVYVHLLVFTPLFTPIQN
jgi:hypothetical protein